MTTTVFRYRCRCGTTDTLLLADREAQCRACGIEYPIQSDVILFTTAKSEQNAHFDAVYDTLEDPAAGYEIRAAIAQNYLTLCGCDLSQGLEGASVLDVASGNGWVTAGLLLDPKIRNSKFHAFDVSPIGLRQLAKFEKTIRTSNALEMSVQDAEAMLFDQGTFD